MNRYYLMPISKECCEDCGYCSGLGFTSAEKDASQISYSLEKAKSGGYSHVALPCNASFLTPVDKVFIQIVESGLVPTLILNTRFIHNKWLDLLVRWQKSFGVEFLCLIDEGSEHDLSVIRQLEEAALNLNYLLVLNKKLNLNKFLKSIPEVFFSKIYVQAPYRSGNKELFFTTRELYKEVKKVLREFPKFRVQKLEGVDVFDSRVAPDMELEALCEPSFVSQLNPGKKKISVVIPSYNNRNYLLNTIRHLLKQDFAKSEFEVIVVDDGSTDGSEEAVVNFLSHYRQQYNIKYIYYPRQRPRRMGDGQYRAGVARNLGVKHASGELLVFLDSDILTPSNYLSELWNLHQKWDVVQTQRLYLKRKVSHLNTNYNDTLAGKDVFDVENGYWRKFYENPVPWNEMPFNWKYVCTYGLSLHTEVFKKVGWFNKNYIFYGFEDTDLGYRLVKAGYTLYKSPLKVLHLFHKNERSEFMNSDYQRHLLLKKTAKIFFHSQLDPVIFEHMRSLVDEGFNWRGFAKELVNRLPGGITR